MAKGKQLDPNRLPLPHRRVIANELIQALRAKKWIRHTRALSDNSSNFRVLGAHASTTRTEHRTETVERYLAFVLLPDSRLELPMLAVLLSGTAYADAERAAGNAWLSLRHLLKARAARPYKIDSAKGYTRVRKTIADTSEIALEALDVLVKHCLIVDITPALAGAFEDALADATDTAPLIAAAEIIHRQLLGSSPPLPAR